MSDTRNCDIVNFEKTLPDTIIKIAYKSIAVWSIVRIQILNQLTAKVQSKDAVSNTSSEFTRLAKKLSRVFKGALGVFTSTMAVIKNRDIEVIIRVNSFSILGEREGRVLFTNGNLQEIYDHLLTTKVKCLVIVNDQWRYKLQQKLTAAIVYPLRLQFLVGVAVSIVNRCAVDQVVSGLCKTLSLERQYLRKLIAGELAALFIWEIVYKYINPKIVYYECPHNCFESEVVAAKLNNIRTVEIFHGGITPNEPSYFQVHLNFDGLVHSVCDEFLSPSEDQTQFLINMNNKYKKVTTINYKPALSLSVDHERSLLKDQNRRANGKGRILFITSITDNDVGDIGNYIRRNHRHILQNFSQVSLRLHPEDSKERWNSLLDTYPCIEISNLTLSEDIESADALVVVSPTVILQLKALNIEFVDLSRSAI